MQVRMARLAREWLMRLPLINDGGTAPLNQVIGANFFDIIEHLESSVKKGTTVHTYYRTLSWSTL